MHASHYLLSTKSMDSRNIILIGKRTVLFKVIGATMPVSISPQNRCNYVESATFTLPDKVTEGLVAIHTREKFAGKYGGVGSSHYLLKVNEQGVDLENTWVSQDTGRIGQLVEESLEVHSQDRTFTSSADAAKKDCTLSFCNDADAMCRYLIDEISLEELEKKSKGDFFTILPPELQLYLLRLREQREFLRADGQRYMESFIKETEVMKLEAWKKAAVALDLYASIPWWKRRDRQESLETARRLFRDARQRSI